MKPEFVSTNGVYIGLSPKMYMVTQHVGETIVDKKGTKGRLDNNLQRLIFIQVSHQKMHWNWRASRTLFSTVARLVYK